MPPSLLLESALSQVPSNLAELSVAGRNRAASANPQKNKAREMGSICDLATIISHQKSRVGIYRQAFRVHKMMLGAFLPVF